jgi:sugar phosphate isomerase/epimerase
MIFRLSVTLLPLSVLASSCSAPPLQPASSAQTAACAPIPEAKIAAQTYNFVHDLLDSRPGSGVGNGTTPERLDAAFAAIERAGFRNVEGFGETLGLSQDEYSALAKKHHLRIVAVHGDLDEGSWPAMLARAKARGQELIGSAGFGAPGFGSLEDTLATAAALNRLGEAASAQGLLFYVHNHAGEFETKFTYDLDGDGVVEPTSVWEIVAANTDPRYVHFEIDIHWARRGRGLDAFAGLLAFLKKYRDRIVLLHVKGTAADGSFADLEKGTTDWPAIFAAAGPGIRYYIWEHESGGDVAVAAKAAHRYLRCGR